MKIYVKSSANEKDFDVFMLMEYCPGGPEDGISGDRFYCLGKFYSDNLETAEQEFEAATHKYPEKDFEGIYVTSYNSAFDSSEEDPYYGMPIVYPDISTLIEKEFAAREDDESVDLPFTLND